MACGGSAQGWEIRFKGDINLWWGRSDVRGRNSGLMCYNYCARNKNQTNLEVSDANRKWAR